MSVEVNGLMPVIREDTSEMLERMLRVNTIIHEQADYLLITSGEMRCPECNTGTLCYLISPHQRSIVECSTPGCLRWDMAPMLGG